MANSGVHGFVGAASGVAAYLKLTPQERWSLLDGCGAAAFGYLAGRLPDMLEPPAHPNHRQAFHSCVALFGLVYLLYRAVTRPHPLTELATVVAIPAGVGYVSHLALDAGTEKRLPVLGKLGGPDVAL